MTKLIIVILILSAILTSAEAQNHKKTLSKKQKKKTVVKSESAISGTWKSISKADTAKLHEWMNRTAKLKPRTAHIYLAVRADRDSLVLRWAPSTSGGWLSANRTGYHIDRITFDENGKPDPSTIRTLTKEPLKPWTKDEWQKRISPNEKFAEIAEEALYGKKFSAVIPGATEVSKLKSEEEELTNRFSFALFSADMSYLAANGLGLRIVDNDVKSGMKYVYRIYTASHDSSYELDTAYAVSEAENFAAPPEPPGLVAEAHDKMITLRWDNPPKGHDFSAYNIYRSQDDGKSYKKLNENPYIILIPDKAKSDFKPSFSDTSVVNYVRYKYMLKGITAFGDLSKPAEVECMGRDMTPPPAPIVHKPKQLGRTSVLISWDSSAVASDMAGYAVLRSPLPLTAYHVVGEKAPPMNIKQRQLELEKSIMQNILSINVHSYIDTNATPLEPYYTVASVDTAGNYKQSLPVYSELVDTSRPSTPVGLTGTIDSLGIVRLHWHLGPEANLIGYRVFWANKISQEFTQITPAPIKDTVFIDTVSLKTITRFVYYKIASTNDRYNNSFPTAVLQLKRPDIIPPQPPVFTNVVVSDTSVALKWALSSSEDVAHQFLLRKEQKNNKWVTIASLDSKESNYLDTAVVKRTTYEYEIEAVDSSGLHSPMSMSINARPYDTGKRPEVQDLETFYDSTSKTIKITWQYPKPPKENYWFVIYKGIDKNPVTEYKSVPGKTMEFIDSEITQKKNYTYGIRVMTDTGGQSILSKSNVVIAQ